jgi:hypothetical protein
MRAALPAPIESVVNVPPPALASGGTIGPGLEQPQNALLGNRALDSVAEPPDAAAGSELGFPNGTRRSGARSWCRVSGRL